jgi:hypothetical protein
VGGFYADIPRHLAIVPISAPQKTIESYCSGCAAAVTSITLFSQPAAVWLALN